MTSFPADIRVNGAFLFPALTQSSAPIKIVKQSGLWTIGYDISSFPTRVPTITDYVLVWNSASGQLALVSIVAARTGKFILDHSVLDSSDEI
jgi:hypothetical protein